MKPIPLLPRTLAIAPRIIWFEPPERALADPIRFMAYAMTYARHDDMRVIREFVSDDDFREALDRAPPGIIEPRSWAYWNSKMGRYPPPPLPKRRFGDDDQSRFSTVPPKQMARESSSRDIEQIQRDGRDAWLKLRQQRPREDTEDVKRRAREEWLAKFRPEPKK